MMRSPPFPKSFSFPASLRAAAASAALSAGGRREGGGAGGGKGCAPLSWPVPRLGPLQHRRGAVCAGCRGQRQTAAGRELPGKSSGIDATTGRSCPGISASGP